MRASNLAAGFRGRWHVGNRDLQCAGSGCHPKKYDIFIIQIVIQRIKAPQTSLVKVRNKLAGSE